MSSPRHLRVVVDNDGAARRPGSRWVLPLIAAVCAAVYVVVVFAFGGR